MSIKLQLPKLVDIKPRLTVVGVGGAGCNAVNNMIAAGLQGVDFVVANTDAQSLAASSAEHRIQLGANLTEGLSAPVRGRKSVKPQPKKRLKKFAARRGLAHGLYCGRHGGWHRHGRCGCDRADRPENLAF